MIYLKHNGKTLSLSQWSDKIGIPVATLSGRLKRNWTVEATLETSPASSGNKLITKNDAEMELNDGGIDKVPAELASLIKDRKGRSTRPGTILRVFHRKEFDKWFETVFIKGK